MTPTAIAQDVTPAVLALWAGVGALVGVGATLVGARSSVGETSASFARRQGRAESASRRAAPRELVVFLIIVLLALAGALELAQFTPSDADQATGVSSSLLVMAAPALILLSGALLAAWLAPLVASWALAIGLRRRGITLTLAMAPLVRGTARFAQMALLTTLALGLACFALVFRASLIAAQASAASYAVGSDARITQRAAETQGFDTRLLATYARLPGMQAVAPVYRTQETTPAAEGGMPIETLAIDPARFAAVASGVSWRADFAAQPLPTLMSLLARPAPIVAGASAPWAIISAGYAARFDVHVGDHPTLLLSEASAAPMILTVAAIVQAFPTLAAQDSDGSAGFVVVSLVGFGTALAAQGTPPIGPNEFWARMTTPGAADDALQRLFATAPQLDIDHLTLLSEVRAATELSPVGAGMRALLLLNALAALALAALGALIQTLAAARRERVRFAILRTLGLSQRTLTLLPLEEVLLTQALGLLVGSVVGAVLVVAVAPLLGMIEAVSAPLAGGGPPIQTIIPWHDFAALVVLLLLLTLIVVGVSVWRLTRLSLNRDLRISED
jgi:putative ABC transport system permease protein